MDDGGDDVNMTSTPSQGFDDLLEIYNSIDVLFPKKERQNIKAFLSDWPGKIDALREDDLAPLNELRVAWTQTDLYDASTDTENAAPQPDLNRCRFIITIKPGEKTTLEVLNAKDSVVYYTNSAHKTYPNAKNGETITFEYGIAYPNSQIGKYRWGGNAGGDNGNVDYYPSFATPEQHGGDNGGGGGFESAFVDMCQIFV